MLLTSTFKLVAIGLAAAVTALPTAPISGELDGTSTVAELDTSIDPQPPSGLILQRRTQAVPQPQAQPHHKILLLGDSITAWTSRLQGEAKPMILPELEKTFGTEVIVRAQPGYNSAHLNAAMSTIMGSFSSEGLQVANILIGSNDAVNKDKFYGITTPHQHVEVEKYRQNVLAIIKELKAHSPGIRIILTTPPPVEPETYQVPNLLSRDNVKERAAAVREIATSEGLGICDLNEALTTLIAKEGSQTYLSDSLHLSLKGYEVWTQLLIASIEKVAPNLRSAKKPAINKANRATPRAKPDLPSWRVAPTKQGDQEIDNRSKLNPTRLFW